MKKYYLIVAMFFFIGCSSTYTISNFSSKQKFYEDFNKSVKDKSVNIILTNDSSFTAQYGSTVFDDTLVVVVDKKTITHKMFLREIKSINYYDNGVDNLSADIILRNGKKLNGENIRILPDSSLLFSVLKTSTNFVPIYRVKKASYKNHLLGSMSLLGLGFAAGAVIGSVVQTFVFQLPTFIFPFGAPVLLGTGAGIIIGLVVGEIIGYTNTYHFNP